MKLRRILKINIINKIPAYCALIGIVFMFTGVAFPQSDQIYPFTYYDVSIPGPCPWTLELKGEDVVFACPKNATEEQKSTRYNVNVCEVEICSNSPEFNCAVWDDCAEPDLLYTWDNPDCQQVEKQLVMDSHDKCIYYYSKKTHDNQYCKLIQDSALQEDCFDQGKVTFLSEYSLIFYAKFIVPIIVLIYLILTKLKYKVRRVLFILAGVNISLGALLTANVWKMNMLFGDPNAYDARTLMTMFIFVFPMVTMFMYADERRNINYYIALFINVMICAALVALLTIKEFLLPNLF